MNDGSARFWHFVGKTLRDGRSIPPDGEWLVHDGDVEMCESGLHASVRAIDALVEYAPGDTCCRVECDDIVANDGNKLVCRRRKILWRIDASGVLRNFARRCALDVIHLWDAPDVVRKYLESGDETLRPAAREASNAARAVSAAREAAMAAAGAAAWTAARAAARAAAWAAAMEGFTASHAVAWKAAMEAARCRQNELLEQMILAYDPTLETREHTWNELRGE